MARTIRASYKAQQEGDFRMNIKSRALGALAGVLAFGLLATTASAVDRPYTEGAVVNVSSIRTEPGMFDEYMKYLAGPYKQLMDEQIKAGIVVSWNVYTVAPQGPHDPDLYLVTTFKNMAALDGLDAKTDPITEKVFGSVDKSTAMAIDREKIRKLVGSQLMRELVIK
jgi:hypothetical protein